ncbi:MAG TPA: hypothetical protein VKC56_02230 [Gallionellaceae bacterium]|nr:hypothetical protein [Gallionellaceae bacterium]
MLGEPVIAALNHLLAQSGWALPRLAAFSGRSVRFNLPPFSLLCTIAEDGLLRSAAPDAVEDASCTVSPTLLPQLAVNERSALERVTHTGDEEVVSEILFLARNLRWDAAEDLSRFTGDIAAERIVRAAAGAHRHARDSVLNFLQALAEYWTEERPLVAKKADLGEFGEQVDALDHAVDELEQRVRRLNGPRAGGGAAK